MIEALVPGPCVLVGHSMGGMTIMALADRHPELFGDKITGVALISTSAGKLAELSLGLPALLSKAVHKVTPAHGVDTGPGGTLVDRSRQVGNDVAFLALRHLGFGDSKSVSPTVVDFAESMIRLDPDRGDRRVLSGADVARQTERAERPERRCRPPSWSVTRTG